MNFRIELSKQEQALIPVGLPCKQTLILPADPDEQAKLSLNKLLRLVFYTQVRKAPATREFTAACDSLVRTLIGRVQRVGDRTMLPRLFSRVFCSKFVEIAGPRITPEQKLFFRLPPPPKPSTDLQRRVIKSDILSSLSKDGMGNLAMLRRAHMADRIGVYWLILAAFWKDGHEYAIEQTVLQFNTGTQADGTNANHSSGLTSLKRRPRNKPEAQFKMNFMAKLYLALSMNRTTELKRSDNEVDMKLESKMRGIMLRELNAASSGQRVEGCFQRALLDIKRVILSVKLEWTGQEGYEEKLSQLEEQELGLDDILRSDAQVDPEFFRMMGRLVDGPDLRAQLKARRWEELPEASKENVVEGMQKQIHQHSAEGFLKERSPSALRDISNN